MGVQVVAAAGKEAWLAAQTVQIQALAAEIAELKRRPDKDSSTLSKAPSSDSAVLAMMWIHSEPSAET